MIAVYRADDKYLHCAPLFHIGGLSSMLAMLAVGATQVSASKILHLACIVLNASACFSAIALVGICDSPQFLINLAS